MSSFKTFNGYEVEDANARKNVGELSKVTPGIGMVEGAGVTITDSAKGVVIDFVTYGKSTQNGTPTPDAPIEIKSVGDMGYFDGELLDGIYTNGIFGSLANYVCSKNRIPCQPNDKIEVTYDGACDIVYVFFYDKNGAYLSHKDIASNKLTTQAIANAYTFHIGVYNANGLTVATAKHICVTINDKYALIVDSVGKNKADITRVKGMSGIDTTIDGNTIVVGAYPSLYGVYLDNSDVDLRVGETYIFSVENVDNYNTSSSHGFRLIYADGTLGSMSGLEMTATIEKEVSTINFYLGTPYTGNLESRIEGLMIRPLGTDATYEPYIHSRKYIPISAPLKGIGEVTDVASLSECEVDRKFAEVVFDGTESWGDQLTNGVVYKNITDKKYGVDNLLCSHFSIGLDKQMYGTVNNGVVYIKTTATSMNEWKVWLQANPITVIYELAEPTTESIEPTEIVTYDNVTQISVSDNAGCKVSYYRDNEDGKKIQELDNRMMIAEDTINNLESNAVDVADDIEDIKSSMLNPNLKALTPSDEPYTIASGTAGNVISFKDTWLNRPLNDCEYLLIVITHRNKTKQIVTIPSIMLSEGATYSFPFNDVQNTIYGAYIKIDTFTRYSIGLYGTAPSDITFMLYNYGHPISVG